MLLLGEFKYIAISQMSSGRPISVVDVSEVHVSVSLVGTFSLYSTAGSHKMSCSMRGACQPCMSRNTMQQQDTVHVWHLTPKKLGAKLFIILLANAKSGYTNLALIFSSTQNLSTTAHYHFQWLHAISLIPVCN